MMTVTIASPYHREVERAAEIFREGADAQGVAMSLSLASQLPSGLWAIDATWDDHAPKHRDIVIPASRLG